MVGSGWVTIWSPVNALNSRLRASMVSSPKPLSTVRFFTAALIRSLVPRRSRLVACDAARSMILRMNTCWRVMRPRSPVRIGLPLALLVLVLEVPGPGEAERLRAVEGGAAGLGDVEAGVAVAHRACRSTSARRRWRRPRP